LTWINASWVERAFLDATAASGQRMDRSQGVAGAWCMRWGYDRGCDLPGGVVMQQGGAG
jgi:hypothetical protein